MGRRAYGDLKRARTLLEALPEALRLFFAKRHFCAIFQGIAPAGPPQNSQIASNLWLSP